MQLSPLLPPTSFWIQPVCSSLSWSVFLSKERVLLRARKDTDRQRAREDPTQRTLAKQGRSAWSRPLVTSWGHKEAARTPLLCFSRRFLSWLYTLSPCFGASALLLLLGKQGPGTLEASYMPKERRGPQTPDAEDQLFHGHRSLFFPPRNPRMPDHLL